MLDLSLLGGDSPLRQRAWTALVLGPVVLGALWWLPGPGFAFFIALVILVGAWEWAQLVGIAAAGWRAAYLAAVGIVLGILWWQPQWQAWIVAIGAVWWVIQAVMLTRVRVVERRQGVDTGGAVAGLVVLCAPWAALVGLHDARSGPALVLFLVMLIWIADSAAYFVGRRWGRTKLAPLLSPGKTRAGVYGALASAGAAGIGLGYVLSLGTGGAMLAGFVCAVTVAFSIVGDLYESLAKRRRGVKDSGQLFPGHGGMLDRIDSLTAAAPVFVFAASLLNLVNP